MAGKCASVDRQLLAKTRMCKFFAEGKCQRGRSCTFAHSAAELHTQPDLFRSQLCAEFMDTGVCRYGAACRFAHGVDQLRPGAALDARSQGNQLKMQLAAMRERTRDLEAQLVALEEKPLPTPDAWNCDGDWSTHVCWAGSLESMHSEVCDYWTPYVGDYGEFFVPPADAAWCCPPLTPFQPSAGGCEESRPSSDCGGCDASTQPGMDSDIEEPQVVVRNTFIEYELRSAPMARSRARSAPATR